MSLSADELAQRILTERLSALDIGELLGPDGDLGATRDNARAGHSQSAPAREPDLLTLDGHKHEVTCVIGLPDGRIATGSSDNSIRVWQQKQTLTQKRELEMESQLLSGHKASVCSLGFVSYESAAKDSSVVQLVSGSLDSNVRVWDLKTHIAADSKTLAHRAVWKTGELVREPSRGVLLLVISENHERVRFHALADGKRVSPELCETDDDAFNAVLVLPNAGTAAGVPSGVSTKEKKEKRVFEYTVATGGYSGLVRFWRIRVNFDRSNDVKCECVAKFGGNGGYIGHEGHTNTVLALAALPGGRLASASMEGTLCLWNVTIRERIAILRHIGMLVEADVCALRDASRPNVIAVLEGFNDVLLWDADKGESEMLLLETNSIKLDNSQCFFKFVRFGPQSSLYCVLLETEARKDPNEPGYSVRTYSGRIHLWPISLPTSKGPRDQSIRLLFEDLKRVLLALEKNGSSAQIQKLKLGAVRLRDEDAPDLAHYLFALPRLSRLDFSSAHCDLSPLPDANISTATSVENASSSQMSKQAKLSVRGLVRIIVQLQHINAQSPSGSSQPPVLSLTFDRLPLSWRMCRRARRRAARRVCCS